MLVKSQKLACSLQSNLTFRAFSPREAYREGSVKSAPHLQERCFLAAILTADDVEDLLRPFNGKAAVKLANGKATEVRRVYLVCGVTVTERDGSS